jgi:hypothetical protein
VRSGIGEVSKSVRGPTRCESGTARLQNVTLTIDFHRNLAIQDIEPFVFAGVAMSCGPDIGGAV